jgi:hypothetical protein
MDIDTFIAEQTPLATFIATMTIRSEEYPEECLPGFYILLIVVLYKVLKTWDMSEDSIKKHYGDSKGVFIRTMWHEEFMEEQPHLYRMLLYFMDCCMEDPDWPLVIDSVMHNFIRILYSVMKENRGRY